MILGLEFNLPTVAVLLIVVAWAVWAVHRLWSRGMCDCHADSPRGCSGGCGGCTGCGAHGRRHGQGRVRQISSCGHVRGIEDATKGKGRLDAGPFAYVAAL